MADNPEAGGGGGSRSNNFGFLTRKIGPLPIWAYAAIAVGIYYWYTHYGPGATNQNQAGTDPQTGQPYAREVGRLREQVRIVRYQPRTRTGPGKRKTDHDKAKEKKANPGGPELAPVIGKGHFPGVTVPRDQHPGQNHNGQHHDRKDETQIHTRWRGPYRAPKDNQVDYVPADTEPDHRPLGV